MSANARETDTKVEDSRRHHHKHHHKHQQGREEKQQEHASSNTGNNSNDNGNHNEMELYSPSSTPGEHNTDENGQSKHARTVENKEQQQQQEQNVEANTVRNVLAHSLSQQHKNNIIIDDDGNSNRHENNTKDRELMTEDNNKERVNQSTEEVRNLVQTLTKKKKKVKKPSERELLPRMHASNKTTATVNESTNIKETDKATSDIIPPTVPEVSYIPQRSAEQGSFNDGMDILQQLMRPMKNDEEVARETNLSEPREVSESESKRKRRSKKNEIKQKNATTPSHSQEQPGAAATNATNNNDNNNNKTNNNNKNLRVEKELVPETLIPLSVNKTRPVESYFVDFAETPVNLRGAGLYSRLAVSGAGAGAVTSPAVISFAAQQEQEEQAIQPLNEEEMLLEQFAEYTDDDSFFSSSEQVIPVNARRHVHDPLRQRATRTVHETLELQEFNVRKGHYVGQTQANMTDAYYGTGQLQYVDELWMYQIHHRDIALEHSSLFIFPPRSEARVVMYNIMHHWVAEMIVLFSIIGYTIFQATWARYSAPRNGMTKPDYMLWADVFYTVLLGLECIMRIFASGLILHERAFLRSPWHWLDVATLVMMILTCTWEQRLWNFTAWRMLRCIKCLTYVPFPVRMKLLAKSILRSTNRMFYVSMLALYFIFFFGLLGLQLFSGGLRHRCYSPLRASFTTQLCRPTATGRYWFYWGLTCPQGYVCREVENQHNQNPHFNFRSFDDIGHAMLASFQIMTFQGWTSLYNETSAGVAVMAILYYVFAILILTWIISPLYLAVFLEKIEYTSRLFMLKQLDLFDHMLTEQKQRMCRLVRIKDYVCRDARGHVPHYPVYRTKYESVNDCSNKGDEKGEHHGTKRAHRHNELLTILSSSIKKRTAPSSEWTRTNSAPPRSSVRKTLWSDEKRIQLQLSLTRQATVAEVAECRRLKSKLAACNGRAIAKDEGMGGYAAKKNIYMNHHHNNTKRSRSSSKSNNINNEETSPQESKLYKVTQTNSVIRSLSVPLERSSSTLRQERHQEQQQQQEEGQPLTLARRSSNVSSVLSSTTTTTNNKNYKEQEVAPTQVCKDKVNGQMQYVDFALGGRVGMVQHHFKTADIGASQQSHLPFAVRQELQAEQIRFLQPHREENVNDTQSHVNISRQAAPHLPPINFTSSASASTPHLLQTSNTRRTSRDEEDNVVLYSSSKASREYVHVENSMSDVIAETTNEQQSTTLSPMSAQTSQINNNGESKTQVESATQNLSRRTERANAIHSRPPRVPMASTTSVIALRESIGVVPHRSPITQIRTQTPPQLPPQQQQSKSHVPTPHNNSSSSQRRQRVQDPPESINHNENNTPLLVTSLEQSQEEAERESMYSILDEDKYRSTATTNNTNNITKNKISHKVAEEHVATEIIVNDPEGGDFRYAQTLGQRWSIIRNIVHMCLMGYPRVLTLYLFEYALLRRKYGLMPLTYTNKYEEAALNKLRARRRRARARVQQQLATHQAVMYSHGRLANSSNNNNGGSESGALPQKYSSESSSTKLSHLSNSYSRFRNGNGIKMYDSVVSGKIDKYGYGNGSGANHYFMYYNNDDENEDDTNSSTVEERERVLLNEEYAQNNYDFPYSDERKPIMENGNNNNDDENDTHHSYNASTSYNSYDGRSSGSNGLYANTLSPIRMARNILENAPPTLFARFMYVLMFLNVVFNAARFANQPNGWETALFYLSVILSALFTLEQLSRILALGFGPFFFDFFNVIELVAVICSLFQLGFSRSNAISIFNVFRLLKWFRVMPGCPLLRHITRVLIRGIPEISYGLLMFTLYMFMWLVLGMSFFGSRVNWIDHDHISPSSVYTYTDYTNSTKGWYYARVNFETFSQAAIAIAQAFSVNRDEWLYASWDGMRVRGGYTVMYFMATVVMAYVLQYLFIALWIYKWQGAEQPEEGDNYAYVYGNDFVNHYARRNKFFMTKVANRLPWFDFTVWRSFKHIHGGFARRDVAPDEVYQLNEDMRRELRLVEVRDRLEHVSARSEGAHALPNNNNVNNEVIDIMELPERESHSEENRMNAPVLSIEDRHQQQQQQQLPIQDRFLRNADERIVTESYSINNVSPVQYVNVNGQLYRKADTTKYDVERQRQLMLAAAAHGEHVMVQNEKGEYEILISDNDEDDTNDDVGAKLQNVHNVLSKNEEASVYYYNGLPIQMPFANRAQLRFARHVHTIPATTYVTDSHETERMLQERELLLRAINDNANYINNNNSSNNNTNHLSEREVYITEHVEVDNVDNNAMNNNNDKSKASHVSVSQGYSHSSVINPVFAYRHTLSAREDRSKNMNSVLQSIHANQTQQAKSKEQIELPGRQHHSSSNIMNNNGESSISVRTRLTKLRAMPVAHNHHHHSMQSNSAPMRAHANMTRRRLLVDEEANVLINGQGEFITDVNQPTNRIYSPQEEEEELSQTSSSTSNFFMRSSQRSSSTTSNDDDGRVYEHTLLPGPKLRYKSVIEPTTHRRIFEVCINCNTHKQIPLKAPHFVLERSANALHKEHCHMAAVRASKQLVLNALIGYVNYQIEHEMKPTKFKVELILGQTWSCGMLLFETLENLTYADELYDDNNDGNDDDDNENNVNDYSNPIKTKNDSNNEKTKSWQRVQEALEVQQWLLSLHVGEEQVGRATLAYTLAHQQLHEARTEEKHFTTSWTEYSLMYFAPSHPVRQYTSAIVHSPWFEIFMLVIIFAASICLAIYTPGNGNIDMGGTYTSTKYKVLHVFDDIFTVIFVLEMVMKWIALGVILPIKRAYFWQLWNIFDCFIVLVSLISWGSSHVFLRYMKVLRCFRLIGSLRVWRIASTLNDVSSAIWNAIPTLANVCLIMLVHYVIWAIIFCSMFMNKMSECSNTSITSRAACEEAHFVWRAIPRNFDNFYESLLTTFETSTGAEWTAVLFSAGDAWSTSDALRINRHPYKGLVFIAYYYLSHFVLFSLLIAGMICAYFATKRSALGHIGFNLETEMWLRMQRMLLKLRPKVQLLPRDPNSYVTVQLHKFISSRWFEFGMGVVILLNALIMSLSWYDMSSRQERALNVLQYIFVAIFTIEILLRLIAHGKRSFSKWCFWVDLFITVLSYIQIGLNTTTTHQVPFNVNVLRLLRVGRVFTVVQMAMPATMFLTIFVKIMKRSVPALISIGFIHVLCVYVFAIVGLHVFGYVVPYSGGYYDNKFNNFSTFVNSLIMTFRISTLENWTTLLRGSLDRSNYCQSSNGRCGPTNWAPIYFIAVFLCFHAIIFPLYMAVMLEHFMVALRLRHTFGKLREIHTFIALWSKYDANAELVLPTEILPILLEELRPPLGITTRSNRLELLQVLSEYDIPDHNGQVYYHEVLGALSKRITMNTLQETNTLDAFAAMLNLDDIFNSNTNASSSAYAAGDSVYNTKRVYEGALVSASMIPDYANELEGGVYGTAWGKFAPHTTTFPLYSTAHFFAASYVQACHRRNKCMRDYYVRMNVIWQDGRRRCVERHVPYDKFGFGRRGLAEEDPATAGRKRGYFIPTTDADLAIMTNAVMNNAYSEMEMVHFPIYISSKNTKRNRRHTTAQSGEHTDVTKTQQNANGVDGKQHKPKHPHTNDKCGKKITSMLPAMYQPVITSQKSRFGPHARDAIRRHEKRSAKLQRKYNSTAQVDMNTSYGMEQYPSQNNSQLQQQKVEQQQQQQILSYNRSEERQNVSANDNSTYAYRSPARTTVYQPPLGTDPELVRQSALELINRQARAQSQTQPETQHALAPLEVNNSANYVKRSQINYTTNGVNVNKDDNYASGDAYSPSPVRERSTSQRLSQSPLPSTHEMEKEELQQ